MVESLVPLNVLGTFKAQRGDQGKMGPSGAFVMGLGRREQGFIGAGRSSEDRRARRPCAASLSSPGLLPHRFPEFLRPHGLLPSTLSTSPPQRSSMVFLTQI